MKTLSLLLLLLGTSSAFAQVESVKVVSDDAGYRLKVGDKDFFVRGMNWGYIPIGHNYSYDLWSKPEAFIKRVLHSEMTLLQKMGVNAIRLFNTVPPKWVAYIHKTYGIYTAVNHLMGRYGFDVDGAFVPNIDYANPRHRAAILADVKRTAKQYLNTPGVLLYMLGNENNYGLHWTSYEIEALPGQEYDARAPALYTLLGEAATAIKAIDTRRPISLTNGDLQYIDLIAKHCKDVDIMGSNVYRGPSSRDLFDKVKAKLKRPFMYTEFGADAYNAKEGREDALMQARMLQAQWQEIYEQSARQGRSGTAIGGFVFQWSDGWWKHKQHENLDVHDTTASWPNGGYPDAMDGQNNMNEEWFGIAAKNRPDADGFYTVIPRTAYYMLQRAWQLDPYDKTVDLAKIRAHFDALDLKTLGVPFEVTMATARTAELERIRLTNARFIFNTTTSKGNDRTVRSEQAIFDHTESVYVDVGLKPSSNIEGRVALNVIGNVSENRLWQLSYENRGQIATVSDAEGESLNISTRERLALYQAEFTVRDTYFDVEGFYRTGHFHWGDEGDLFGLFREAYYGHWLDVYQGNAPYGAIVTAKGKLSGLKIAFGPELYWGANPSVFAKYSFNMGSLTATLVHQEDIARKADVGRSFAVPELQTRKTTLSAVIPMKGLKLELGGIMAGSDRVGREFRWADEVSGRGYLDSGYAVYDDTVGWLDTLGAKARANWTMGRALFHAQAAYMGLVADGGPDTRAFGWTLRQSGRGNHYGGELGIDWGLTDAFRLMPKVLYQQTLIGPNPTIRDYFSSTTGLYYPGLGARNVIDDPFVVRENRETIAAELLFVYDPTPATWFWMWDRQDKEDAAFAFAIDLVYWHFPTSQDARVGIFEGGVLGAFGGAPPARDNMEAKLMWTARAGSGVRLNGMVFGGLADAAGDDPRQVKRFGTDVRVQWSHFEFMTDLRFDDWGPYDYHRDFNLTFPVQWSGEFSWRSRPARLEDFPTRFGIRSRLRTLDACSEGYRPRRDEDVAQSCVDAYNEITDMGDGLEYDVGTFMEISL